MAIKYQGIVFKNKIKSLSWAKVAERCLKFPNRNYHKIF